MFFEMRDRPVETDGSSIDPEVLTVGCVSGEELAALGKTFGFDEETIVAGQKARPLFRTGVDVHGEYTFAELKAINRDGSEDAVSLFVKRIFLLIVDLIDADGSTVNGFFSAIRKYPANRINEERLIFCFIDSLLSDGSPVSEELHNRLTDMEESIVRGEVEDEFNTDLLELKKKMRRYYNFYGQILDIAETLDENENEILNEDNLIYISNLIGKVTRLKDDMSSLIGIADHVQDAYATLLDQRMNDTMKALTILTTIFFPLTIIVGWYGMNFKYMPELAWKYGYLFVTLLSAAIVILFVIIGKKKKWY